MFESIVATEEMLVPMPHGRSGVGNHFRINNGLVRQMPS